MCWRESVRRYYRFTVFFFDVTFFHIGLMGAGEGGVSLMSVT